jgi:cytochrome c peroxidase
MKLNASIFTISLLLVIIYSCRKDPDFTTTNTNTPAGTPYTLAIPTGFSKMPIPAANPLTVEGIELGRFLFYEPLLSANNKQSCASCHRLSFAMTDSNTQFSTGVDGLEGTRNAMPIFNLGWNRKGFFWDGGAADMENQVIGPITNPVEMHETLPAVIKKLQAHPTYPTMFKKAFGTDSITTKLIMYAVAQFERTIISANSKYDKSRNPNSGVRLTQQEEKGAALFVDNTKGDCFHCHVIGSTFTDFDYKNNGLDSLYSKDQGRYKITHDVNDIGKFKTPTLRNIALTAPYMHDGRLKTLEEVVSFYNNGYYYPENLDVNMRTKHKNAMTKQEEADLVAFLKTLTDTTFTNNPNYKSPF